MIVTTILALTLLASGETGIERHAEQNLAGAADTIEAVSVEGKLSWLEYRKEHNETVSYRPPLSGERIAAPALIPFGNCLERGGMLVRKGNATCGMILDLERGGRPLDLLPFDEIGFEGAVRGTWRAALADEAHVLAGDNVQAGPLTEGDKHHIALGQVVTKLDLKRLRYLVFILESQEGAISARTLTFTRHPHTAPAPRLAAWLWDRRIPLADPAGTVAELARQGITRLFLQVGNDPAECVPFLKDAHDHGIEVFALDGEPAAVRNPAGILARVKSVSDYSRRHLEAPFAGFQADVEPYLNKDFNLKREEYAALYLEFLKKLRGAAGPRFPISVALPFWFSEIRYAGNTLAFHAVRLTDETAVMSYRSDLATIMQIATDPLSYGEKLGKPVYLGLELTQLPDEHHDVYRRAPNGKGELVIGKESWIRASGYEVRGESLSFFGRRERMEEVLRNSLPFSSFAGWAIHSYEALRKPADKDEQRGKR